MEQEKNNQQDIQSAANNLDNQKIDFDAMFDAEDIETWEDVLISGKAMHADVK